MAHHYIYSLATLANRIRQTCFKNSCPHIAGQMQIFAQTVPYLTSNYIGQADMDWIKYTRPSSAIKNGYHKEYLPYTTYKDSFDMYLISWLPGAITRVHNHSDHHITISAVISGKLNETLFTAKSDSTSKVDIISNAGENIICGEKSSCLDGNVWHSMCNSNDEPTYSLQIGLIKNNYNEGCSGDKQKGKFVSHNMNRYQSDAIYNRYEHEMNYTKYNS